MPRFLTRTWVDSFNVSMAEVVWPAPAEEAGLVAQSGRFTVAEEVHGGPDGDVVLVLSVDDGTVRLFLAADLGELAGDVPEPDVTIALGYEDAAAMARGELSPAEALTAGRVRVRGDLAVLIAGQEVLAEARRHTGALAAETTY
ncbi:MAG TPA: SCP2 sterol-binding domain-containing protein [Acidimicrobiales bacterium]|nr:SCP2 sterol-binding domain-containing protein [Acidimicrobiales bacterium]